MNTFFTQIDIYISRFSKTNVNEILKLLAILHCEETVFSVKIDFLHK